MLNQKVPVIDCRNEPFVARVEAHVKVAVTERGILRWGKSSGERIIGRLVGAALKSPGSCLGAERVAERPGIDNARLQEELGAERRRIHKAIVGHARHARVEENTRAPAQAGLAVAEHVPSKTDAWREIVQTASQTVVRKTRVAGEEEPGGRVRKDCGMYAGDQVGQPELRPPVLDLAPREPRLPAQACVYGQAPIQANMSCRDPLTAKVTAPGKVFVVPWSAPPFGACTAPDAVRVSEAAFRPFKGSSVRRSSSITCLSVEVDVSTTSSLPVTVTTSVVAPSFRVTFRVSVWSASRRIRGCFEMLKSAACTLTF